MTVLAAALLCLGVFFLLTGALGLVRFPDFYARMHAAGKCDTLGTLLVLGGLATYEGVSLVSARILLIAVFVFFTGPTATHAVARAAIRSDPAPAGEDPEAR